jgi:DNA-binding SARP family transcriptional activator
VVEFLLLGPLQVRAGDRLVEVPSSRQRAVLALLLLEPNQVVPVSQLVDGLWGERPPKAAVKNIHLYVSRIRKALVAHEAPGRLRTAAPGYLLSVGDGELDTDRFRALVRRARQLAQADGPAEALDAYRQALTVHRGATLADVAELPGIQPRSQHWDERVLGVREDFLESALAVAPAPSGPTVDEVVGELRALVGRHPHRERLRYLLMLALHRAGRPADALAVYQATHRVLADEFGLEPGPELRELQRSILAPAARRSTAAGAGARYALEPPSDIPTFVGRERETALLDPHLETPEAGAPPAVCLVEGPPGVGKSALAVHLAHWMVARFPGGRLYLDLRGSGGRPGPLPPREALHRLLCALGVDAGGIPADEAEMSALFRGLTAGTGRLLVLDNAASGGQALPLLPGHGCAVLVTGAKMMTDVDAAVRVPLDALPPADAAALLRRLIGPARCALDPAAVTSIADSCEGLPLALRQAGTLLAGQPGWPVRVIAERLRHPGSRLDELSHGEDRLRTRFGASYRSLLAAGTQPPDLPARLFRLIGARPAASLTFADVVALSRLPRPAVAEGIDRLVNAYLLESPRPGCYRMRDLLRAFAAELAERYDTVAPGFAAVADSGGVAAIYRPDTGARQSGLRSHQPARQRPAATPDANSRKEVRR